MIPERSSTGQIDYPVYPRVDESEMNLKLSGLVVSPEILN